MFWSIAKICGVREERKGGTSFQKALRFVHDPVAFFHQSVAVFQKLFCFGDGGSGFF